MPLVRKPGIEGLVFVTEECPRDAKRYDCPDCFYCQQCSETRCRACRSAKKAKGAPPVRRWGRSSSYNGLKRSANIGRFSISGPPMLGGTFAPFAALILDRARQVS